jgi:hypothetical protein
MLRVLFKKSRGVYKATISCSTLREYNIINRRYITGAVLTLTHSDTDRRIRGRVFGVRMGGFRAGKRTVANVWLNPVAF